MRKAQQEVQQKENGEHRVLEAAKELPEGIPKYHLGNERGKHYKAVCAIGCDGNCLKRNWCCEKKQLGELVVKMIKRIS